MTYQDILTFWFIDTPSEDWFNGGEAFDDKIKSRFEDVYQAAKVGEYEAWQDSAKGALALCLVLDQFPRNMYRGTPEAFASDGKALDIAKKAVGKGFDQSLKVVERRFLYLPYEHSEDIEDQRKSVELFTSIKDEDPLGYDYAIKHLEVIEKYGRFPHRNKILGREDTPEEEDYLSQPDAGF